MGWAALVIAGCAESDNPQRCLPGTTQACLCTGSTNGVQICNASGTGVGACTCDDADPSDTASNDSSEDTTSTEAVDDGDGPSSDTTTSDATSSDSEDAASDVGYDVDAASGDTSGPNPDATPTDTEPSRDSRDDSSPGDCPVAVITVAQGDEVQPQTRLELDGSNSIAGSGEVTGWEWSVEQPQGSVSVFVPSSYVADPSFEVNVIGTYTFRLKVFDALGTVSCSEAEYVVNVTSDDAIHVELLWNTPGDPDQSDTGSGGGFSAGSDVDLHFLHPRANGVYFDWTYDCYWESPTQEWGFFGPSDNPNLDRDDTDGAGPENLNVGVPEQNVRFQVGTHYWSDWGYGYSLATVRIYIYGVLRDQWPDVRIVNGDMWDSHYVDWPSGFVTRITAPGGGPRITPNYPLAPGPF